MVTKSICDYAKENKIPEVIFSSSATVYGEPNSYPTKEDNKLIQTSVYGDSKEVTEETIINPLSPYGRTKVSCEMMLDDCAKELKIKEFTSSKLKLLIWIFAKLFNLLLSYNL